MATLEQHFKKIDRTADSMAEEIVDFKLTEEQERFRQEIQEFLEEELRKGTFRPTTDAWLEEFNPEFSRKIGQKGWLGLTWPKEYGGKERSYLDRLIRLIIQYAHQLS